jgi:hypothetical protein
LNSGQNAEIRQAWRVLFGSDPEADGTAAAQLEPEEIRRAFLRGARLCHPDLARSVGENEASLTRRFQRLQEAYTILLAYAQQPEAVESPVRGSERGSERSSERSSEPSPEWSPEPSPEPGRWIDQVRSAAADAQWGSAAVSMSGAHWIGPVPTKPLRLGRFLYHTGRITREALSDALHWQRAQRRPFGSLAVDLGLLDPLELGTVLDARRMGERIGRTAVRLGLLTPQVRDWIVSHQQRAQRPIGSYFVERGVLSEQDLSAVLQEQQHHNQQQHDVTAADEPSTSN